MKKRTNKKQRIIFVAGIFAVSIAALIFIIVNFKNNLEPGWIKMTSNCSHLFFDPINQVGNWAGNLFYKNIHTQANRTTAYPGCCSGTTGGLDDRFDFIMGNGPLINGTSKMKFLPATYRVFGNDGSHFNLSNATA